MERNLKIRCDGHDDTIIVIPDTESRIQENLEGDIGGLDRSPGLEIRPLSGAYGRFFEGKTLPNHQEVNQETFPDDTSAYSMEPIPETKKPLDLQQNIIFSWALEILAMMLSFSSAVTTIGLLVSQNGKSVNSWSFILSLNTLISILGTTSRVTLAFAISACIGQQKWNWARTHKIPVKGFGKFDTASRGPWGAIALLYWLKARHWAVLGAVVTICLLSFDPVLQAIVGFSSSYDDLPYDANSAISRTNHLNLNISIYTKPRDSGNARTVQILGPGSDVSSYNLLLKASMDAEMVLSAYSGFSGSPRPVELFCSTGNCTWPIFTSLTVCSSCHNVTDKLKRGKSYIEYGVKQEQDIYFLPYANISRGRFWSHGVTIKHNETIRFANQETLFAAFALLQSNMMDTKRDDDWHVDATECGLFVCAKAFKSVVEAGTLLEEELATWSHIDPRSWRPSQGYTYQTVQGSGVGNTSLVYAATADQWHQDVMVTIPNDTTFNELPSTADRIFNMSVPSFLSLSSELEFLLSKENQGATKVFDQLKETGGVQFYLNAADLLSQSKNLTATAEYVARSMTNQIRNYGKSPLRGTSRIWVLVMHINWPFAIPLGVILLLGYVYVLLTFLETHKLKIPIWKDDILPLLAYGLDDDKQEILRGRDEKHPMNDTLIMYVEDKTILRLQVFP